MYNKVALVTGASSGIGEAAARQLRSKGFTVFAAARRIDRMSALEADGIHVVPLDITDEASIQACLDTIRSRAGGIDVLVNNAGYGSYGAVEDVTIDEARRQFEVNLFGLARLTQLVLPRMRANHWGKIVNITSMGGKIYTPFGAWYHATKHALEGWSDALRIETQPFGIDVIIVEPGGINTPWGAIAVEHLLETSGSGPYAAAAARTASGMGRMYASGQLSDPEIVAREIVRAVTARRPRTRYAIGYMARPVLFLRWLLPDRVFDRMITTIAA
jgi:NAD(P)-dependent dehydrogenase (short-subunit alcohol dehydrogenase family)